MSLGSQLTAKKDLIKFESGSITDWVFDLDNTIYPANSSLFPRVVERMISFIANHFNIAEAEAAVLKTRLFRQYGTTMHGLMREHNMEPDEFLFYVHEIDLSDVSYDKDLDDGLGALSGRKHIYTNGTARHAERILTAYGIRHHFDHIYDIVALNTHQSRTHARISILLSRQALLPIRP